MFDPFQNKRQKMCISVTVIPEIIMKWLFKYPCLISQSKQLKKDHFMLSPPWKTENSDLCGGENITKNLKTVEKMIMTTQKKNAFHTFCYQQDNLIVSKCWHFLYSTEKEKNRYNRWLGGTLTYRWNR